MYSFCKALLSSEHLPLGLRSMDDATLRSITLGLTYAQRNGWLEFGYHKAYPLASYHGVDWGYAAALRDWPIGCSIQLCQHNQFYDGPPSSRSLKLTHTQVFVDTSHLWTVVEVFYTSDFPSSRWISVRISNPAEDVRVWTNVVREPNVWRSASRRDWNQYTNLHTLGCSALWYLSSHPKRSLSEYSRHKTSPNKPL